LNRTYGFLGTAIAVASDEPSILEWLDEFLSPAFEILPVAATADFCVTIRSDPSACEAIAATRPDGPLASRACFALDQEVVAHPHWVASGRIVLDDVRFGAFYVLEENRAEVVIRPGSQRSRSGAMRVIREAASARALTDPDLLLLHAAALEHCGKAVLIAGPKGSGKTTTLSYLAAASGARILTNDRSLLRFGGAEIEVRAIPTVVSVREGALELLSLPRLRSLRRAPNPSRHTLAELAARDGDPQDAPPEPFRLSPAQLAHAVGVSLSPSGRLCAIAFPEVRPEERSWRLDRLSQSEAYRRLQQARFGVGSAKSSPTVFEDLMGAARNESKEARWLAELAGRVPCFGISIGARAYSENAAGLDLVERLTREAQG
jgi:hypothetical protein